MKSAEELFSKHCVICAHVWALTEIQLKEVLTEHDKEMVDKIDEMLEEYKGSAEEYPLTELKQWLNEK